MDMPLCPTSDPRQNKLIAALPADAWLRWSCELELVDLTQGQVLAEPGRVAEYAYFPTTAIVSLLYITEEGESSEFAVVGNDGVIGTALFMGGESSLNWSVVQSPGQCYRLRSQAIKNEIKHASAVLPILMRYTQSLMSQVAQTAACNRYRSIDQLLCRRLMLSLERLESDALVMTQELMASLLGVRREGVTVAAIRLQRAGVISYSRGKIMVLDREQLAYRTGESVTPSGHDAPQQHLLKIAA